MRNTRSVNIDFAKLLYFALYKFVDKPTLYNNSNYDELAEVDNLHHFLCKVYPEIVFFDIVNQNNFFRLTLNSK